MGNLCCTTNTTTNFTPVIPSTNNTLLVKDANETQGTALGSQSSSTILSSLRSNDHVEDDEIGSSFEHSNRRVRRWRKGRLLAQGAFGRVFAGIDLSTGCPIAIKHVQVPAQPTRKDLEQIKECLDEIKTLEALRHPNIVHFLGSEHTRNGVYAFIEYAGFGSVAFVLDNYGPLPEAVVRRYLYQVVSAVEFLHRRGYVHRDIKSANILVMENGVIKLADFGASKMWIGQEEQMHFEDCRPFKSTRGTPCFMAPEILLQERYGRGVDIWAIGCTLIEMATGLPPWAEVQNHNKIVFKIRTAYESPPLPRHLSKEAIHFLTMCFEREPERRPSAEDLMQHPFLQNCALSNEDEESCAVRTSLQVNNAADISCTSSASKSFIDLTNGRNAEAQRATPVLAGSFRRPSAEDGLGAGTNMKKEAPSDGGGVQNRPVRVTTVTAPKKVTRSQSFKNPSIQMSIRSRSTMNESSGS